MRFLPEIVRRVVRVEYTSGEFDCVAALGGLVPLVVWANQTGQTTPPITEVSALPYNQEGETPVALVLHQWQPYPVSLRKIFETGTTATDIFVGA